MNEPTADIIDKFVSGTANPEENALVETWYQSCTEGGSLVQQLTEAEVKSIGAKMWEVIMDRLEKQTFNSYRLPVNTSQ